MVKAFQYYLAILELIIKGSKLPWKEINSIGGRKSGKTLSSYEFALLCIILAPASSVAVHSFRNIKKDIKEAMKEYKQIAIANGWEHLVTFRQEHIECNGNTIYLKGLRNRTSDAIVGLGLARDNGKKYSIRIFDEGYEYSKADIDFIMSGLGGSDYVLNIYNSNPWLETHWYIKKCNSVLKFNEKEMMEKNEQYIVDNGALYHYTNFKMNDKLKESDKEQLAEVLKYDPVRARVEYYGLPGVISGGIYGYYMNMIKKYNPEGFIDYFVGIDYGEAESSTTAQLIGITFNNEIVYIDEYYYCNNDNFTKMNMLSFANALALKCKEWKMKYKPNNSPLDVAVEYASQGLKALLEQNVDDRYCRFWDCEKMNELFRINLRKWFMSRGKYYVLNACSNHYRELSVQIWDKNKAELKAVDKDNHTTDAGDYGTILAVSRGVLKLPQESIEWKTRQI